MVFLQLPNSVSCATTTDDNGLVIGLTNGHVQHWRMDDDGRWQRVFMCRNGYGVYEVPSVVANNSFVVSCTANDSTVSLWSLANGGKVRDLNYGGNSGVCGMAISCGDFLLVGHCDGTIVAWDLDSSSGEPLSVIEGAGEMMSCIAASHDGQYFACGYHDRNIRVYEVDQDDPIQEFAGTECTVALTYTVDDRIISATGDTIRVNGDVLCDDLGPTPLCLAIVPDGRHFVYGDAFGSVRLCRLDNGAVREVYSEQAGMIRGVAVTPDGSRLISASEDRTVRIWDLPEAEMRASFRNMSLNTEM